MRTEHLREFVAFSRHLNFSSAAKELYIAQSTLSTHIAQLEDDLGMQLVDRSNRNRLTDQGVVFLEGAKRALSTLDSSIEHCERLQQAQHSVKVAYAFPSARFARELEERTHIPLAFVDPDFRSPFFDLLLNKKADILVTYDFSMSPLLIKEAQDSNLVVVKGPKDPFSISMMKDNALAKRAPLQRTDLAGACVLVNSAPDYERYKMVCNTMLGDDLGLSYRLSPVGSLSDLKLIDYGTMLHVCGAAVNDHYFRDRSDMVIIDKLDGKPFGFPSAAVYRSDANDRVQQCVQAIIEYKQERNRRIGLE